ncbi:MAG: PEP-CTERM sorting domain-containing protein [Deltaproteobacteria bacterium]|nr:PEP-CTERM sorting domain-containing protein [Deltaproteobacteria bacterium]
MKKLLGFMCAVMMVLGIVGSAGAVLISGIGDPLNDAALTGGTQIDFEDQILGSYTTLTIGDVTFTANDNDFQIDNTWQSYNQQGIYLDNGTYNDNGFGSLTMSFTGSTNAFGFTWGMAEPFATWVLTAYNAANTVLDTQNLPSTGSSSSGEYYGIAADGTSYATLSWSGSYDWIAIDNFTYTSSSEPVPEPSTILLMGTGLLGIIGFGRKRFNKKA